MSRATKRIRKSPSFARLISEISRLATGLAIALALTCVVSAQVKVEKTADVNAPVDAKASATSQTAELNKAEELSARVLKLFADEKYDEALRLAKRVLEIREKVLGPEHPLIDEALYNLAEIYIVKLKYTEAESLYQRLLVRYEKVYGPEHVKTAPMVEKLGYLSYRRGDLVQAETLLLRARAIYEMKMVPGSEKVVSLSLDLATIYRTKKDFINAEASYLRSIELSDLLKESRGPKTISIQTRAYDGYICFLRETRSKKDADEAENRLAESRKKKEDRNPGVVEDYLNGRALVLPKPPYPAAAKNDRVEGTVIVRVNINESGDVTLAWAVCGPPLLRDAAVIAASKARFSPTSFDGKPIVVTGIINYHFGLR